jgi:hypothetical protein
VEPVALDIRPIRTQQELSEAKTLLAPDALEPEWVNAFVLMEGSKVNGVFCPSVRLIGRGLLLEIEPLHIKHIGAGSIALMWYADAHMRAIAEANGLRGYSFVTKNPAFQRVCERHFPLTFQAEGGAKRYFRVFS